MTPTPDKTPQAGMADRVVVFIRAEGFYPITVRADESLARHAELNPGTLRIDDIDGNVLWRPQ